MELLKEIMRTSGISTRGKTIAREAIRGIILDGARLLMIHSGKYGEYKFPGGGRMRGESHQEALAREIREECGGVVTRIGAGFGRVIEYDRAVEPEYDLFRMTSYYYLCEVEPVLLRQELDQYEQELGFKPAWVKVEDAIRNNQGMLDSGGDFHEIPWLARETFILGEIYQRLILTPDATK